MRKGFEATRTEEGWQCETARKERNRCVAPPQVPTATCASCVALWPSLMMGGMCGEGSGREEAP